MKNITAGFLTVEREQSSRFPYTNRDGRYYSELIGRFKSVAGSDPLPQADIIVRGTFDKDTYKKGLEQGFQVVIYPLGQQKSGYTVYEADDRTQAYESVQSVELQEILEEKVEGVGETYAKRLVTYFNESGDFFTCIRKFIRAKKSSKEIGVPYKIIENTLEEEGTILQTLALRSVSEASFYNTLNQLGFVAFKGKSALDFQRGLSEWSEIYLNIDSRIKYPKNESLLGDHEELVDEYGKHFVYLMLNPEIVLEVLGSPMTSTVVSEQKNVKLAQSFLQVAESELEEEHLNMYDLQTNGIRAFTIDVYGEVKRYKDDGYNNPRTGDSVFPYLKGAIHKEIIAKNMAVPYEYSYEEAIDKIKSRKYNYPVVVFETDGKVFVQFKRHYDLNANIVKNIKSRVDSNPGAFVEEEQYIDYLNHVLDNNSFKLHKDQYDALVGLNKHPINVLTGGPGTGKTTILSVFLRTLAETSPQLFDAFEKNIVFAAPTGKAAKRMKESLNEFVREYPQLKQVQANTFTIHSYLLNNAPDEDREDDEKGTKWLVIDESSMVDEEMLAWILNTVPESYRLVFIGDTEQLPSIGPGSVLKDLLTLDSVGTFNLTKPYRSTGTVMENAYKIRNAEGHLSVDELTFDRDFAIIDYDSMIQLHKQQLGSDNLYYQYVAQHAPDMFNRNTYSGWAASFLYKQEEDGLLDPKTTMVLMPFSNDKMNQYRVAVTAYNQVIQGVKQPFRQVLPYEYQDLTYDNLLMELNREHDNPIFDMNKNIQSQYGVYEAIGANGSVIFRIGDEVISNKNQYQSLIFNVDDYGPHTPNSRTLEEICTSWYARLQDNSLLSESKEPVMNGDMGVVKAVLRDGSIMVQFYDHPDGKWVYYQRNENFGDNLSLSYSTTVHKSQGGEEETVVLFLADEGDTDIMNYKELIYTAITRAKSKVVIIGSHKVLEQAINNKRNNRHTALPYLFKNEGMSLHERR